MYHSKVTNKGSKGIILSFFTVIITIILIIIGYKFINYIVSRYGSIIKDIIYILLLFLGVLLYKYFFNKFKAFKYSNIFNSIVSIILMMISLFALGFVPINDFTKIMSDLDAITEDLGGLIFIDIFMVNIILWDLNFALGIFEPWNKNNNYHFYHFWRKYFSKRPCCNKNGLSIRNLFVPNNNFTNTSLRHQAKLGTALAVIIMVLFFIKFFI